MRKCPRCESPAPHLHPAIQFDGEVQPCTHKYHKQITPENTKEKIEATNQVLGSIDTSN